MRGEVGLVGHAQLQIPVVSGSPGEKEREREGGRVMMRRQANAHKVISAQLLAIMHIMQDCILKTGTHFGKSSFFCFLHTQQSSCFQHLTQPNKFCLPFLFQLPMATDTAVCILKLSKHHFLHCFPPHAEKQCCNGELLLEW